MISSRPATLPDVTHNQYNAALALASRNAMILLWLKELEEVRALDPIHARRVARAYAEHTNMPLCEVEGALRELTTPADLDFLWGQFEADIRAADFLRP